MNKAFLVTFVWIWFLITAGKFFTADVFYVLSNNLIKQGNALGAIKYSQKSIEANPNEPRYYYGKAKINLAVDKSSNILPDLEKAVSLNPKNLVTLRNIVPYYKIAAEQNPEHLPATEAFYLELLENYPHDAGVQALIAKYTLEKASISYTKALENIKLLRPDLLFWFF